MIAPGDHARVRAVGQRLRAGLRRHWAAVRLGAAFGAAALLFALFSHLNAFPVAATLAAFSPKPDTEEYGWVALRFARGESPLMPIAAELHPSRFSPVHPFLLSLWMRARGGTLDALASWPGAALVGALLLFTAATVRLGISAAGAALFAWLFLLNMAGRDTFTHMLSESSMLLLLGAALLAWSEAIGGASAHAQAARTRTRALRLAAALLCGACMGALAAMRPTMLFFAAAFPLHALLAERRRAWPSLAAYAVGAGAALFASAAYIHHFTGTWSPAAYGHWVRLSAGELFQPAHTVSPHFFPESGGVRWMHDLAALAGWNRFLWNAGPAAIAVLWFGGIAAVMRRCAGLRRDASPALAAGAALTLAALALFAVHLFYRSHGFRFLAPLVPVILLFGIAGWEDLLRGLRRRASPARASLVAVAAVAVAWVLASPLALPGAVVRALAQESPAALRRIAHDNRHHRIAGTAVHLIGGGPLFVDQMSGLHARLAMGLESEPAPILPLRRHNLPHLDSHTVQFIWFPQIPRGRPLDPRLDWPRPPDSYLWNPETREVNAALLTAVLRDHGRALLYYPDGAFPDDDLFAWCEAQGHTHEIVVTRGVWQLAILRASTALTPPE